MQKPDLILVGGGLSSGLIAMRLKLTRPELRCLIIEQEQTLGGEHTWSFHTSDLTPDQFNWIKPIITQSWPSYRALFPQFSRTLPGGYHSVASAFFHEVISKLLPDALWLGRKVKTLTAAGVTLEDGTEVASSCVIDARGFFMESRLIAGYQKFLGMDVVLDKPHGEVDPILMDGRTEQKEGLRFFYTLPWAGCRMQIGEARYTESPVVPREEFREAVRGYAAKNGWNIVSVEREEVGVLPAPQEGKFTDLEPISGERAAVGVPRAGVRAGLFHATTGYSLPYAVRFAEALAKLPEITSEKVLELSQREGEKQWKRGRYFRLLNRMMFRAAAPTERLPMFQQFYRRPAGLIERFYGERLKLTDYLRIMTGKPPISLISAMNVFLGRV